MTGHEWKIRLPVKGRGEGTVVELDGKDITVDLNHISIEAGVGHSTEVTLTFIRNAVAIDFETEDRQHG